MSRPTAQEATAIGKIVCYTHRPQGKGASTPRGKQPGGGGLEAERGKSTVARAFIMASAGRKHEDKVNRLRVAQSESF